MAIFDLEALVVAPGNFEGAFQFASFGATLLESQQRIETFTAENDDNDLSASDFANLEVFVDEGGIVRDAVAEIAFYEFVEVDTGNTRIVMVIERENTNGLLLFEVEPTDATQTQFQLTGSPLPILEYRIPERLEIDAPVSLVVDSNGPPVVEGEEATVLEDGRLDLQVLSLLSNDSDPDGDTLEIIEVSANNGEATLGRPFGGNGPENDFVTYIPDANFNGTDEITYVVSDGNGNTTNGIIVVTVEPQPDAPEANDDGPFVTAEDTPLSIPIADLLANDIDIDGDNLTIEPFGQGFTVVGDNLVYTPPANFNGTANPAYLVRDPDGLTSVANVEIEVTPVNDAPVALSSGFILAVGDEDIPLTVELFPAGGAQFGTDVDGDTLTVDDLVASSGTVELNGDGTLTHTPEPGFSGDVTITFSVSDGEFTDTTGNIRLRYNAVPDDPDAVDDGDFTTGFQTVLQVAESTLLANDTDQDGDTLTVIGVGNAVGGTVERFNGNVIFTPDDGFEGAASFEYTISDGNGGTDTATVSVIVGEQPQLPPVAADDSETTDEDEAVTVAVLANDSDANGDTLTITDVGTAANGTLVLDGDSIVYTPDANFNGDDSFEYTISDGNGGTDTATVNVTVNSINDDPDAVDDDGFSTAFETELVIDPSELLGNDTDVDGDTLEVVEIGLGTGGSASLIDGVIVFTPDAGFDGTASFEYTISDGNGGSDTATVSIIVGEQPPLPPVAADDSETTDEDEAVTISVLANDSDPNGDALTITGLGDAANGTVAIEGDSIVYTPDMDFNGTDEFEYTISDGNGGTDTATVNITVRPVNDAPDAVDDAGLSTGFETVLQVPEATLLANDSDVDGDSLTITSVGAAIGGIVELFNGNVIFTPNAGFSGSASFEYTISDGNGGTDTATASVTVDEDDNRRPDAVDDEAATVEDEAVTISVLANDSDPDGDAITIIDVDAAANGTVQVVGDDIVYTPDADFAGVDSFEYTISDGNGGEDTATVVVNVSADQDPPVAADDVATTREDESVTIAVLANDVDLGGDPLTITDVGTAANGTLVLDGDSIVYTPDANFNGEDSFEYTISDSSGNEDTATVSVTVDPVNDDPVAVDDDGFSTAFETDLAINPAALLANDSDVDGDALEVVSVGAAIGGSASLAGGVITFTPDTGFDGDASFEYTISDGNGGTDTASVSLVVEEDDDTGPNVVNGTAASEPLAGTNGADIINANGGSDLIFGFGGADVFAFDFESGNGREVATVRDYEVGIDLIDLGGDTVINSFAGGGSVFLFLGNADFDTIVFNGVTSVDDLEFV